MSGKVDDFVKNLLHFEFLHFDAEKQHGFV